MTTHADPRSLVSSALRAQVLSPVPASFEEDKALEFSVAQIGVTTPIVLDFEGFVLDGMRRVECAIRANRTQVPVVTAAPGTELLVVMDALANHRNLTKGALAYIMWPQVEPMVLAYRELAKSNLARGTVSPSAIQSPTGKLDRDGLIASLPFGKDTLAQAEKIHRHLAGHPEHRSMIEEALFCHEAGLGGILGGIGGKLASEKGQTVPKRDPLQLLLKGINDLGKRWDYLGKLGPQEKQTFSLGLDTWADSLPDEVAERLARRLEKRIGSR